MLDFSREPIRTDLRPERLSEKEKEPEVAEDKKNKNNS